MCHKRMENLGVFSIIPGDVLGIILSLNGVAALMARLNKRWHSKTKRALLEKGILPLSVREVQLFHNKLNNKEGLLIRAQGAMHKFVDSFDIRHIITSLEDLYNTSNVSCILRNGHMRWYVQTITEDARSLACVISSERPQSELPPIMHTLLPQHMLIAVFCMRGLNNAEPEEYPYQYAMKRASRHIRRQLEWLWSQFSHTTLGFFLSMDWYETTSYNYKNGGLQFREKEDKNVGRDCYLILFLYARVVLGYKKTIQYTNRQVVAMPLWYLASDIGSILVDLETGEECPVGNSGSESESEED